MKEIKAIIQPFMLSHVLDALHAIEGFTGATTSEVHGVGPRDHASYQRHPRVKLEIIVPDKLVGLVVDAIQRHAHTGNPGDGDIFVIPVEMDVRIRSGARIEET